MFKYKVIYVEGPSDLIYIQKFLSHNNIHGYQIIVCDGIKNIVKKAKEKIKSNVNQEIEAYISDKFREKYKSMQNLLNSEE